MRRKIVYRLTNEDDGWFLNCETLAALTVAIERCQSFCDTSLSITALTPTGNFATRWQGTQDLSLLIRELRLRGLI